MVIAQTFRQLIGSRLVRGSGIYTIASFTNAAIPFLLLPFLTTRLTPGDYGIITMFATVQAFLLPVLSVNLEGAVARKYYSKDTILNEYIGNCLFIFTFTGILSFLGFLIFDETLEKFTGVPSNWIHIVPLVTASQFLCTLALTLWQVKEKPGHYAIFQIAQSTVNAFLTVVFILGMALNWEGRLLAITITMILFAIIAIIIFWKQHYISFVMNRNYLKHALKYGGGLVPHAIGGMLILLTNRMFLNKMISIEESGYYGVANQICSVITFFTVSFNNAFVPWLFKKLSENNLNIKTKIVKLTYLYFAGISLAGLIFYFIQPLLFRLFVDEKFLPAFQYCLWITLGFVFQGMYFMVTNYINYAEKTHLQAILTITIGLINIIINYVFIEWFGAMGAAVSFTVIFMLFFVATWILSAKVYPMPWFKTLSL